MALKKRKWWAAGLLSGLAPGVGQIYNGQLKKAALFYGLNWIPWIAAALLSIVSVFAIASLVVVVAIVVLVPIAMAGAQRYRLSRTSWRKVREVASRMEKCLTATISGTVQTKEKVNY